MTMLLSRQTKSPSENFSNAWGCKKSHGCAQGSHLQLREWKSTLAESTESFAGGWFRTGDLAVIGPNLDGSPWRIGISDPKDPQTAIATLFVSKGGVATSGDYERYWEFDGRRYGHILNPLTGWPVQGLLSATVAAESCLEAGTFSTTAILKSDEGIAWLSDHAPAHLYTDRAHRLGGSALDNRRSKRLRN